MGTPLTDQALDTIFRTARTYNGYDDTPVTGDDIRRIYELIKMGPTSANQQPARFVWCLSPQSLHRLADCATGANPPKISKAPAAVIVGMDPDFHEQLSWLFPHDKTAKSWFKNEDVRKANAFRNSSLQGAYFIIAARALGFDTGPMSGFDEDKVNREFFEGTKHRANFISTLGHGDPSTIFERSPRPEFDTFNRVI